MSKSSFKKQLSDLINRNSIENGSNTPDFILAEYLSDCLKTWEKITKSREKWYGTSLHIGMGKYDGENQK
jgi:hypothetical protein